MASSGPGKATAFINSLHVAAGTCRKPTYHRALAIVQGTEDSEAAPLNEG